MSKPTGRYLCSEDTFKKAAAYLKAIKEGRITPGDKLAYSFPPADLKNFEITDPKELIARLMNTRIPTIQAQGNGCSPSIKEWNADEMAILADIVFSTTGTHAFNNGSSLEVKKVHNPPLNTHFLFVASALLVNDRSTITPDMDAVLVDGKIDEERFYELYERRLLPGLLIQNEQAKQDKTPLVINIPELGCLNLAEEGYETQVRALLPRVLKRFFKMHASQLDMIRTVNYAPYDIGSNLKEELTADPIHADIKFMIRSIKEHSQEFQLEFPQDGTDYIGSNHRLIKIVPWNPFSFPGNAAWGYSPDRSYLRKKDEVISFLSSDVISALLSMGQFGSELTDHESQYDPSQGIVHVLKNGERLNNQAIAYVNGDSIRSDVRADMIDVISRSGEILAKPLLPAKKSLLPAGASSAKLESETPSKPSGENDKRQPTKKKENKRTMRHYQQQLKTVPEVPSSPKPTVQPKSSENPSPSTLPQQLFPTDPSKKSSIQIVNPKEDNAFDLKKNSIQQSFMTSLETLKGKIEKCRPEERALYDTLNQEQKKFFSTLTQQLNADELRNKFIDFGKACKANVEIADKIMGHGWLYRIAEVLIKAVVGLFAGIGMVLGSLICRGLANQEDRQKYAKTFFALNKTDESKVLDEFKQTLLFGNDLEHGLLALENTDIVEMIKLAKP